MNRQVPRQVKIYTPESALTSPRTLVRDMFRDLAASRELAWRLALRDVSAQYRQAAFGFLWALLLPLGHSAIWVVLSLSGILALGVTDMPYPVFVLTGTMLWAIFLESVNAPIQVVSAARDMLAKISFPREALILSGVYQVLFNASIKLAILFAAMFAFGISPSWNAFLVCVSLASLVLVGTSLGLLLTPVGLLYSDIGKGLPFLMQFLMYLTPIVYPLPVTGGLRELLLLNPLTPLIETARAWLVGGDTQWLVGFLLVNGLAALMLLGVWIIFRLAMPIIIERMSS